MKMNSPMPGSDFLKKGGSLSLLVRTPNWLGDLVMSFPALSILADEFPDMSIWSHPRVSGLIPVFFPSIPLYDGSGIRGHNFTRLLLMTDSFRSAFQGFLAGIPERIGHNTDMRSIFLTKAVAPPSDRSHHHADDYLKLASAAEGSGEAVLPAPSVQAAGEPHTAYFAGARYGSAKMWRCFPELAGRIYSFTGLPSVFYGSPSEETMLRNISSDVPRSEVRTDLTLKKMASNLLSAVLTFGNDSGGVHVSAALDIPTVTIFGSTSPLWTAPCGNHVLTVNTERECSPCFKRKCPKGTTVCLTDITVDEVYDAGMGLLAGIYDE